jgi:hypothetical protein
MADLQVEKAAKPFDELSEDLVYDNGRTENDTGLESPFTLDELNSF